MRSVMKWAMAVTEPLSSMSLPNKRPEQEQGEELCEEIRQRCP